MSTYTRLNVLIVTKDASYISTQIDGDTQELAWKNAIVWAASRLAYDDRRITTASPVYIAPMGSDPEMEKYTVGECIRELKRIQK